ncbi:hypothetical protein GCM10027160_07110 [Streptomyces calidiresistens]
MPHPHDAPAPIPGAAAIRVGIVLLGVTGFALSYDALRQTAVAIHVRGPLTYLFPLVIDGFIAIGIGALLILRNAPLRSRFYVWALVGLATVTSIWANGLHAVRLNQQTRPEGNLRLDDLTVGALSAIAPLALAGAVHLYLLVRRRPTRTTAGDHRHTTPQTPTPSVAPTDAAPRNTAPAEAGEKADDGNAAQTPTAAHEERRGRRPGAPLDELVAIGRTAPPGPSGRVSRRAVEQAIREAGHSIGRARLVKVTDTLQAERDRAHRPARPEALPVR